MNYVDRDKLTIEEKATRSQVPAITLCKELVRRGIIAPKGEYDYEFYWSERFADVYFATTGDWACDVPAPTFRELLEQTLPKDAHGKYIEIKLAQFFEYVNAERAMNLAHFLGQELLKFEK